MTSLTPVLLLASLLAAPESEPFKVEVWRGAGPHSFRETTTLAQLPDFKPQKVELDQYGGWANAPASIGPQKKTGFFYVSKSPANSPTARTWLISPEGNPYLNIAVNTVSTANREPKPGWTFSTDDEWRDKTLAYLKSLGFNGSGAWSRDAILSSAKSNRLAYTPIWNFMSAYGKKRGGTYQQPGHTGYPNDVIFVFDPEFPAFCDEHAKQLIATKDDPYLLGHLTDNEMPIKFDALDRYLDLPESDAGHQAAAKWLAERRKTKPATRPSTRPNGSPFGTDERAEFRGYMMDTYFRIVTSAIRKYDPNHLVLGSRFHANELSSSHVFKAAGKHLDVISINWYNIWTPPQAKLNEWASWSGGIPVVITEWYAKGADSGFKNISGAGFTVPTQGNRGHFYQNFTLALLQNPNVVGWHWFKYVDNDPNDLKADPSNRDSNKGLVTIDQKPYEPLANLMKQLNESAYPLTQYFDGRR